MGHTPVTTLSTDFAANLGGTEPDTVLFLDERVVGIGIVGAWDTVNFSSPFEYNGHDNLLVEVTWNGTDCGDEDAVVQYGFSLDGTWRRAWEWDWQATTAQRADNCEFNTLFGFADAGGVEEERFTPYALRITPNATVVRGVLRIGDRIPETGYRAELLDASGRKVMEQRPGENDVHHLAPGVYFVHAKPQASSSKPQAVTKVVVQR